jgi:putative addiction module component (TIGR02574 family)
MRRRRSYDFTVTTKNASHLLDDVLQLPRDDRARFAAELLASLDDPEMHAEASWAEEIERRAAEAHANPQDEDEWRDAFAAIRQDVLPR